MTTNTSHHQPPEDYAELVLAWIRRARESQMAHYEMANMYDHREKWLGVPVIIISTIVGTSAFASIAEDIIPLWAKFAVGGLSIVVAVLSSLQTFFKYSEKSEIHKSSAAAFGASRRKLEFIYASKDSGIDSSVVSLLRSELDTLASQSPHIPVTVFKKIQEKTARAPTFTL